MPPVLSIADSARRGFPRDKSFVGQGGRLWTRNAGPVDQTLRHLEAESVHIIREASGQLERLGLLFSGGKDSIVLTHLARRAFYPAPVNLPLLHIDTGHNFPETIDFRDRFVAEHKLQLIVARVEDSIRAGQVAEESGPRPSRNAAQTVTLLDAITQNGFQGLLGGARRDEEKARAKERFFSHRDQHGQWQPKNQRPEVWGFFNGMHRKGEHFRVFPLSNWTEKDVWRYIVERGLEVPSLYFSHQRRVVATGGMLLAESPWVQPLPGESAFEETVRFRTIGDMTCTGACRSNAATLQEVYQEIVESRSSERGTRADDRRSAAAMEERKLGGYF